MTQQSIFGSNVDLPYVKDYGQFLEYHRQLDPAVMTPIVDKPDRSEIDKLKAAARDFPNATIIARVWHELDGGFHLPPEAAGDNRPEVASAEGYIDSFKDLGQGNMILSVLNEPTAFDTLNNQVKLVSWCVRAIQRADETQTRICLPNWGDRNPFVLRNEYTAFGTWTPDIRREGFRNAPDDLYDPMLLAIAEAKHPELFSIGLHCYGPDGYVETLAGLVGSCAWLGLRCPDVYISEFGLDTEFEGDPKDGYFGRMSGDVYARWHAAQLDGPLRPYVEAGIVKGITTFGYGHTERWKNYDVERDRSFQDTMIALKKEGKLSIAVQSLPQSMPKPADPGPGRRVICRKFRNIRSGPSTRYHDDGDLPDGATATVYDQRPYPERLADNSIVNWWWMESENGNGWIQSTGWRWDAVPASAPAPVEVPPDSPTFPPVEALPVVKRWAMGFEVVCTDEQGAILEDGFRRIFEGMALIGQIAGAGVTIRRTEVPDEQPA